MTEILYDRGVLGVVANRHWTDAQEFSNIAAGVDELATEPSTSIRYLPKDTVGGSAQTDNAGVDRLKKESKYFIETMNFIVLEFSDACGVLGSGTSGTMANADITETATTEDFDFLTSETAVG